MIRAVLLLIPLGLLAAFPFTATAQAPFEEAVVDVGNVGLTVTNAGFIGRSNVRNNPTGPPSFEYPLDSGIEHLFEAGLWVGAQRPDGSFAVRSGAVTASGGYSPGAAGYDFAPLTAFRERSSLPSSQQFSRTAVSQQDFLSSFADTFAVLPGTNTPMDDPAGALGLDVQLNSYAWSFPFAEAFVILNFEIVNISSQRYDSVYVGLYHDLVVRNVNTTTESGGNFFNKGGLGYIDSLQTTYAFNAGGPEQTLNTYGSFAVLGAQWPDPDGSGQRFFHPAVAEQYRQMGLTAPYVNARWWRFSGGTAEQTRPGSDRDRYTRMSTPYPNPSLTIYDCEGVLDTDCQDEAYLSAVEDWYETLRTSGLASDGNWIGMTSLGPFPAIAPGDTLSVTFAAVAALKPEEFQGQSGKAVDTEASRSLLRENVLWARRTYGGEDNNYNGMLDPGEDVNNNGRLDRYLIPEPPRAPQLFVDFQNEEVFDEGAQDTRAVLFWDRSAEESRDPVTGEQDFEGYRIYRSNPGDDRSGNIQDAAALIAQFDEEGNGTGFNTGLDPLRISSPDIIPAQAVDVETYTADGEEYYSFALADDGRRYVYHYPAEDLLNGWQYLFSVTAFDEGDPRVGLPSFESGRSANAVRIFPGTPAAGGDGPQGKVGVYPNPYRVRAAWDGESSRSRRINFYNVPERAEIRIYTMAGEIVTTLDHDAATYSGDIRWYQTFSGEDRQLPGGEHSWDVLSENDLDIASGLYFYTVKDLDSGEVQHGKFVIIK